MKSRPLARCVPFALFLSLSVSSLSVSAQTSGTTGGAVDGGAEPTAISVVRAAQDDFAQCYEAALARQPTLTLHLELAVSIGPNGRVDAVSLEGTHSQSTLAQCVVQRASRLRFPRRMAGTRYAFPLDFHPAE